MGKRLIKAEFGIYFCCLVLELGVVIVENIVSVIYKSNKKANSLAITGKKYLQLEIKQKLEPTFPKFTNPIWYLYLHFTCRMSQNVHLILFPNTIKPKWPLVSLVDWNILCILASQIKMFWDIVTKFELTVVRSCIYIVIWLMMSIYLAIQVK